MLERTEIVRELDSKPINTGLFAVSKLYIKYKKCKDELCIFLHNSSSFFFT